MSTAELWPTTGSGATFLGYRNSYRIHLWRIFGSSPRQCTFIMLNPSTATATEDDPTVRRCLGYARREVCGRLDVVNIFALRATDPRELYSHADPTGDPSNFGEIIQRAREATIVVCAWGSHGKFKRRGEVIEAALSAERITTHCLGRTLTGEPKHPLYLRADAALERFT